MRQTGNETEMTTEDREQVLVAGAVALVQQAVSEGHEVLELVELWEGEARTMIVEELARLEMI